MHEVRVDFDDGSCGFKLYINNEFVTETAGSFFNLLSPVSEHSMLFSIGRHPGRIEYRRGKKAHFFEMYIDDRIVAEFFDERQQKKLKPPRTPLMVHLVSLIVLVVVALLLITFFGDYFFKK